MTENNHYSVNAPILPQKIGIKDRSWPKSLKYAPPTIFIPNIFGQDVVMIGRSKNGTKAVEMDKALLTEIVLQLNCN